MVSTLFYFLILFYYTIMIKDLLLISTAAVSLTSAANVGPGYANLDYLDRFPVVTGSVTKGLRRFKMKDNGGSDYSMQIWSQNLGFSATKRNKYGQCHEAANRTFEFLDRHNAACQSNDIMNGWYFSRWAADGGVHFQNGVNIGGADMCPKFGCHAYGKNCKYGHRMNRQCSKPSTSDAVYKGSWIGYSGCNKAVKKSMQHLDRHNVECPSGYFLNSWRLGKYSCSGGDMRIRVRCVKWQKSSGRRAE